MFSIYDADGRHFRDTLDKLRKVRQTQAIPAIRLRSNVTEDESSEDQDGGKKAGKSAEALHAYQEVRQPQLREPVYHAYQLMSHPVITLPMDMGILEARRYFQQQRYHQMPVINAQQRLVGMLTLQDLLQFINIEGDQLRMLRGKRVSDAMLPEVISADPSADIRLVARLMLEYRLHGVPIVDEQDKLVGIVSRSDILRAITHEPPLNMWS